MEEPNVQEARIISSGVNQLDFRDISYQKLERKMLQSGGKLTIYTNKGEEPI